MNIEWVDGHNNLGTTKVYYQILVSNFFGKKRPLINQ